ncbi:SIS domain-containing protein [Brucella sp. C7-11G]
MPKQLPTDIAETLNSLAQQDFSHVFLVACGGSLSIMHPGKYFLDRHSELLTSDVYNGDEFVTRDPRRLNNDAIVILCSQTGTTKETVRAAEHARRRGACVISLTLDPQSPLAAAADHVLQYQASYTTGIPIDGADSNYSVLYMLLAGIVDLRDKTSLLPKLLESLPALQPAIERGQQHFDETFTRYAERYGREKVVYTMASGPVYGAAYSFSICVLMEMLWINSQAIHANEFFHGPFEVVDKNACFVVMIGLDETRALAERGRDFLYRFGEPDNMLVLDAAKLDLADIDDTFKEYFVPLIFFDALWKFAYKLAAKREQVMLDGRRYMKKITDY